LQNRETLKDLLNLAVEIASRATGQKIFLMAVVIANRDTGEEIVPYGCGYCQQRNR